MDCVGTRVDMHVKRLDERVVERAKARDIDVLVYAPHFRRFPDIAEQADAFSDEELTILPGRELFTGTWRARRHVLAIGLSQPVPDFIPLEAALTECERQGATVLVPHPTFLTVSLTSDELRTHRTTIDAIEVYNPKMLPSHTRRARALIDELNRPAFGSSYAHLRRSVGEVWTVINRDIRSIADLQHAIRDGDFAAVERREGVSHTGCRVLEFGHLFWENSWQKLDRVLLADVEATHPRHPAYDGRFDDVALY